ncbi:MAG TPA: SDR family oxidoreductase [Mesorhizobium sp.]|jgi:NAD(P)-dependent dehydrogenase (short-subunit alcohol dehydrogenase family)|nr:SDR family oxidoreductase [Mesorhizobium sp.]
MGSGATEIMDERPSVAVITGAAGDIGRAIAAALLDADHNVVLADINLGAAEAAAAAMGGRASAVACDITDPASVERMARAAEALGPVAVLVNNAGGITSASLQSTGIGEWRRDTALNLDGAMLCFRALEGALKATRGTVVNIASVNGFGVFGHPGYSVAKAALLHLTRLIAVEYGRFGIRANAVAPGTVMTQAWNARASANPRIVDEVKRWYPLDRLAEPADVAAAVRFLSGPGARAITGICLPVDCGLTAGQVDLARTFSQSPDY